MEGCREREWKVVEGGVEGCRGREWKVVEGEGGRL